MYECNAETLGATTTTGATYPVYYEADVSVPGGYKLVVGNNSGYIPCTSATRPAHSEGTQIAETDTGKMYTSVSGAWVKTGNFTDAGRSKYRLPAQVANVLWLGSGQNTKPISYAAFGREGVDVNVGSLGFTPTIQHAGLWSLWFRLNLSGSSAAVNAIGSCVTINLLTSALVPISSHPIPIVNNAPQAAGSVIVYVPFGTVITYTVTNGDTTNGFSLAFAGTDDQVGGDWIGN